MKNYENDYIDLPHWQWAYEALEKIGETGDPEEYEFKHAFYVREGYEVFEEAGIIEPDNDDDYTLALTEALDLLARKGIVEAPESRSNEYIQIRRKL